MASLTAAALPRPTKLRLEFGIDFAQACPDQFMAMEFSPTPMWVRVGIRPHQRCQVVSVSLAASCIWRLWGRRQQWRASSCFEWRKPACAAHVLRGVHRRCLPCWAGLHPAAPAVPYGVPCCGSTVRGVPDIFACPGPSPCSGSYFTGASPLCHPRH